LGWCRESVAKHDPGACGTTRKGSPALRHALIEAAHAAARSKNSYLAAQFHRLAARRGTRKAAVSVGHSLLIIVWHLLDRGDTQRERPSAAAADIARGARPFAATLTVVSSPSASWPSPAAVRPFLFDSA
jgi:hypothetical protein